MKNIVIIQARYNSTRLPGKVLMEIEGKTILQHVYNRVKQSKLIDDIIVAIPENDKKLIEIMDEDYYPNGMNYFCGDEISVLDRFYKCVGWFFPNSDNIVRITADCPLISWEIIDKVIEKHIKEDNDYTCTGLPGQSSFPDGCDVGIMKREALYKTWDEAKLDSERWHVTPYITNHPELFKIGILKSDIDYSKKRWTIDEIDDYYFIMAVYEKLHPKNPLFTFEDIIELLNKYPEYEYINNHIGRDEGYFKDIKNES
jgi:spore coat polysaccharide biosynthesis protein SpsF